MQLCFYKSTEIVKAMRINGLFIDSHSTLRRREINLRRSRQLTRSFRAPFGAYGIFTNVIKEDFCGISLRIKGDLGLFDAGGNHQIGFSVVETGP